MGSVDSNFLTADQAYAQTQSVWKAEQEKNQPQVISECTKAILSSMNQGSFLAFCGSQKGHFTLTEKSSQHFFSGFRIRETSSDGNIIEWDHGKDSAETADTVTKNNLGLDIPTVKAAYNRSWEVSQKEKLEEERKKSEALSTCQGKILEAISKGELSTHCDDHVSLNYRKVLSGYTVEGSASGYRISWPKKDESK